MTSFKRILEPLFLMYLGVFLFMFSFRPLEKDDNWWHLKTGQWIAVHGQVPHEDPFCYAGEHTRWVCIHWLGSLAIYGLNLMGGLAGLKIFKSVYFVFMTGIFYFFARRKMPLAWLAFLCLPLAYVLLGRLLLRPDVFNFFFIQVFLIQLFAFERTGDRRWILTLPLWSVLWNNLHLGSFIYGTSLIVVFLCSAVIRSFRAPFEKQVRDLALVLVLNFAVLLVNPYGLEGFLYPFKVFLQPGYIGFYQTTRNTFESQSSVWAFLSIKNSYYHVLLFFALWGIVLNRRDPWTFAGLLAVAMAMFLSMIRNGPFFALVCVYIFAEGMRRSDFLKRWKAWSGARKFDGLVFALAAVIYAWHIIAPIRLYDVYQGRKISYLNVISDPFSESAIALLKDHGIAGNVFCGHILGNEIIWRAYPDLKPIWDGRYLDLKRYKDIRQLLNDPDSRWLAAESKYQFQIAILDVREGAYLKTIKYLAQVPQWQIIAIEGAYVIYVKKGVFVLDPKLADFQKQLSSLEFSEQDNAYFNELLMRPLPPATAPRPHIIDVFFRGSALMALEYYSAAFHDFTRTLAISNDPRYRNAVIGFVRQVGRLRSQ